MNKLLRMILCSLCQNRHGCLFGKGDGGLLVTPVFTAGMGLTRAEGTDR